MAIGRDWRGLIRGWRRVEPPVEGRRIWGSLEPAMESIEEDVLKLRLTCSPPLAEWYLAGGRSNKWQRSHTRFFSPGAYSSTIRLVQQCAHTTYLRQIRNHTIHQLIIDTVFTQTWRHGRRNLDLEQSAHLAAGLAVVLLGHALERRVTHGTQSHILSMDEYRCSLAYVACDKVLLQYTTRRQLKEHIIVYWVIIISASR